MVEKVSNIFKSYDIRGKDSTFSRNVVLKLARAISSYFSDFDEIVIGLDMRNSSKRILEDLVEGLSPNFKVLVVGASTTPYVRFCCNYLKLPGIMITASHIPEGYNGLKLFDSNGNDVFGAELKKIKDLFEKSPAESGEKVWESISLLDEYSERIREVVGSVEFGDIVNLYIGNGVEEIFRRVFSEFGLKCRIIKDNNFNDPLDEKPYEVVRYMGVENCFIFDGDADRCSIMLNKRKVDSDYMMCFYVDNLCKKGDKIAVELMMPLNALEKVCKEKGVEIVRTRTGRAYILEAMKRDGCKIGGEYSYHYSFLEYSYLTRGVLTDDGIVNCLICLKYSENYNSLYESIEKYYLERYSRIFNFNIEEECKQKFCEKISQKISKEVGEKYDILFERNYEIRGENFRVLVRPSETESKVRVIVESLDRDIFNKIVKILENDVE